jgi:hypothetical protein
MGRADENCFPSLLCVVQDDLYGVLMAEDGEMGAEEKGEGSGPEEDSTDFI